MEITVVNVASILFLVAAFGIAYFIWIRPILKSRPATSSFFAFTDSRWQALRMRLSGIKQKLLGVGILIVTSVLTFHDSIMPLILPVSAGIDWTPVTSKVPDIVWPFLWFGIGVLLVWFRNIAQRKQQIQIQAIQAGIQPAPAQTLAEVAVIKGDA